jgi:APA family basic amino acid/polyamine antiporter
VLLGGGKLQRVDYLEIPSFYGVLSGAILAFFAYIGFESIAKMGEEIKEPEKNMPRAILLSILITTFLYIVVALAAVSIVSPETLYKSPEPVSTVAEAIHPSLRVILSIIALFSTGNTVLLILISTSRMIYGLASQNIFPQILSKVHPKTNTPHYAVWVTGMVAILLLFFKNIQTVAEVTNLWIFICFFFVNLSVLLLRYKKPYLLTSFKAPLNIGKFPILSFLGLVTSLAMIVYTFFMVEFSVSHPVVWLTLLLILLATAFYWRVKE